MFCIFMRHLPPSVPRGHSGAPASSRPQAPQGERSPHGAGLVHAWVGQIVTFFAYSPPSRPLGSLTPTQPGRVTDPTRGCPGPPWEAPQAECWLLRREPKPGVQHTNMSLGSRVLLVYS